MANSTWIGFTPAWATPTFAAGNFTGNNSMTWTVASADVVTLAYTVVGKQMTVSFNIQQTTVGGTPSTDLQIAIPLGLTSAKSMHNACFINDNLAGNAVGRVFVTVGGSTVNIAKIDGAAWSASTDNTYVFGEIIFEIA